MLQISCLLHNEIIHIVIQYYQHKILLSLVMFFLPLTGQLGSFYELLSSFYRGCELTTIIDSTLCFCINVVFNVVSADLYILLFVY